MNPDSDDYRLFVAIFVERKTYLNMKYIKYLTLTLIFILNLSSCKSKDVDYLEKDVILGNITRVADYELNHPSTHDQDLDYDYKNGWIPATFYVSLVPLYEATSDSKYLEAVKAWGAKTEWDLAPRFRHADDIVCGQVYLDFYRHEREPVYINKLKIRMDSLIATKVPGREDWSWCDALFMAPPVYMMAGNILNEEKYTKYADEMYWDVYDFLFDQEESLFYRDERFFTQKSPNGSKLFWGRGNGWVLGGLARMIPYIKDETMKERYVSLFKKMSEKIITLQQEDNMWRSNLLDADHWAQKESSGSAFYVYALTWGINNGILESDKYGPIVEKSWKALSECINQETGMIGWVQPIGASPGDTKATTTFSYGAGAYVLAGVEMLTYIKNK
tara:strand:- start:14778 stop:15944 length:1167 start_codon:yes stop_codon:yes gene_type:complete